MKAKSHLHTLVRFRSKDGHLRFRCTHADCWGTFDTKQLVGKRVRCSKCDDHDIILTRENLRRATPLCIYCSGTKEAVAKRTQLSQMEQVMKEILDERNPINAAREQEPDTGPREDIAIIPSFGEEEEEESSGDKESTTNPGSSREPEGRGFSLFRGVS